LSTGVGTRGGYLVVMTLGYSLSLFDIALKALHLGIEERSYLFIAIFT